MLTNIFIKCKKQIKEDDEIAKELQDRNKP